MAKKTFRKPEEILAILQSIPEDESECETEDDIFDSDDEEFVPQNISSESEDSQEENDDGKIIIIFYFILIALQKEKFRNIKQFFSSCC